MKNSTKATAIIPKNLMQFKNSGRSLKNFWIDWTDSKEPSEAIEGELAVVRNVNTILSQQLVEADQYFRRLRMIVTGL